MHPATAPDVTTTTEATLAAITPFVRGASPEAWRLAVEGFRDCVLGKVYAPEGPTLKHRWLSPGGCYRGQWMWDTQFVADLLAILPEQRQVLAEVFQNYWDFQDLWSQRMPDHASGF
jgi:hypothetical protein